MDRELRTSTPRTLREAFGRDVVLGNDERPLLRWPRAELLVWLPVAAVCLSMMVARQDPTLELRRHGCTPLGQAVDGQWVWQCMGGELRVSNVGVDAL